MSSKLETKGRENRDPANSLPKKESGRKNPVAKGIKTRVDDALAAETRFKALNVVVDERAFEKLLKGIDFQNFGESTELDHRGAVKIRGIDFTLCVWQNAVNIERMVDFIDSLWGAPEDVDALIFATTNGTREEADAVLGSHMAQQAIKGVYNIENMRAAVAITQKALSDARAMRNAYDAMVKKCEKTGKSLEANRVMAGVYAEVIERCKTQKLDDAIRDMDERFSRIQRELDEHKNALRKADEAKAAFPELDVVVDAERHAATLTQRMVVMDHYKNLNDPQMTEKKFMDLILETIRRNFCR